MVIILTMIVKHNNSRWLLNSQHACARVLQ